MDILTKPLIEWTLLDSLIATGVMFVIAWIVVRLVERRSR